MLSGIFSHIFQELPWTTAALFREASTSQRFAAMPSRTVTY